MARNNPAHKLTAQAEAAGVKPVDLVLAAFNRTGTMRGAARELGVGVTTVRFHLLHNGYRPEKRTVLRKFKTVTTG